MAKQFLYLPEFIARLGKNTVGRQKLVISTSLKAINLFESSEEEATFNMVAVSHAAMKILSWKEASALNKIGIYIKCINYVSVL